MKQQLLLLEDVDALGKKGEVVTAKPGYIRNFLLPKKLAIIASANTLRKQERLRAERKQQEIVDRQESEELVKQILSISLEIRVKVDPEGHMYGSVSAADIAQLFQKQGLPVDKKNIALTKPIKETGPKEILVKLKEGVTVVAHVAILPEGMNAVDVVEQVVKPIPPETESPSA